MGEEVEERGKGAEGRRRRRRRRESRVRVERYGKGEREGVEKN